MRGWEETKGGGILSPPVPAARAAVPAGACADSARAYKGRYRYKDYTEFLACGALPVYLLAPYNLIKKVILQGGESDRDRRRREAENDRKAMKAEKLLKAEAELARKVGSS